MGALSASFRNLKWYLKDRITITPVTALNAVIAAQLAPNNEFSIVQNRISEGDHLLFFNCPENTALSTDGYFEYQTPRSLLKEPTLDFKRRMWALGSMEFKSPLQENREYICEETVRFMKKLKKDVYVGVHRAVLDAESGETAVNELRTLVYTQTDASSLLQSSATNTGRDQSIPLTFNSTDIFRYSALTYNAHKVHWDRNYCQNVEGYRDVIVQGPYMVHIILKYVRFGLGLGVKDVKYKNVHVLYPGTAVSLCVFHVSPTQKDIELKDVTNGQVYCKASVGVN
ncbi:LAFA_0G16666g1_1 [Lachancea sp. 'fantastica']|nr:LAFA_0G16666g1_1 [Lachancea sp. 'fantastica']